MATFHGKGGSITWGGAGESITILSWTCNAIADVAEKTTMGDPWKTYLAGFLDWTATVECVADDAAADLAGLLGIEATLSLEFVDAGHNLEGNAIGTGVSFGTDSTDVGKVSYTFQGSGVLAYGAN